MTRIVIVAMVIIVGGGSIFFIASQNKNNNAVSKEEQNAMMEKTEDSLVEKGAVTMEKPTETMLEKKITITLDALHNSNEQGTATIRAVDNKTVVNISLSGTPAGSSHPAHIHVGACPTPDAVKYPLTNVVNGVSETMLNVSYDDILAGLPLAINVHESAAAIKTYVSCGDIRNDSMMEESSVESMDKSSESMMEKTESAKMDGANESAMMVQKGSYEVYSSEKLARAEKGDVVLFFRATWCPSCQSLDKDIRANLGSIPDGLSILEVDYDTATALKQKYGVTYQHTLVQVDNMGNLITKWSGSPTLAALAAKVQ